MKTVRSTIFFIFVVVVVAKGQVGMIFPDLEGETLSNQPLKIPGATNGKITLLGLAYSKKSEEDLKTWFNPIYQKFIYKPKNPGLFHTDYDVNVYFVPMFTGVKKAAYKTVMKKMKAKTDPRLVPHILFYKGEIKKYKRALDFERKDVPYFFVLNDAGKIIYATSGSYTDDKIDEIESLLEE